MGNFSFTKADVNNTKIANIMYGAPFKMLIPQEFGGGYIKDHYMQSGKISDGKGNLYDIFELLAFWNAHMPYKDKTIGDCLVHDANQIAMKPVDLFTETNRRVGIAISHYDDQMEALTFPLKLVSWSYSGTYEECEACSYNDPNQGCEKLSWKAYENCKVKYRQPHLDLEDTLPVPYTADSIDCEDLIVEIETDDNGNRQARLYAYGYCTGDGSEPAYRFVEYTFFYVPLDEVLQKGIFEVESEYSEFIKQYITDCTEDEMLGLYKHYDAGNCPKPIIEAQLTATIPDGTYVVQYPEERRA